MENLNLYICYSYWNIIKYKLNWAPYSKVQEVLDLERSKMSSQHFETFIRKVAGLEVCSVQPTTTMFWKVEGIELLACTVEEIPQNICIQFEILKVFNSYTNTHTCGAKWNTYNRTRTYFLKKKKKNVSKKPSLKSTYSNLSTKDWKGSKFDFKCQFSLIEISSKLF